MSNLNSACETIKFYDTNFPLLKSSILIPFLKNFIQLTNLKHCEIYNK